MAKVIGFALTVYGTLFGQPWAVVAGQVLLAADADQQAQRQRRRARAEYNAALQDRLEMVDITPDAPRTLALGRVRAAEGVRRKWVSGANSETLTMVVSFAGHEIDGFEQFYFNDTPLSLDGSGYVLTQPYAKVRPESRATSTTLDGNGSKVLVLTSVPIAGSVAGVWATGSGDSLMQGQCTVALAGSTVTLTDGPADAACEVLWQTIQTTPTARIRTYLGTAGQNVGADLAAEYPGKITNTDRFAGIALAVVDITFDPDVFPQGRPNITALFRGARCFDPRDSSTVWTENPALHVLHYARWQHGWNVPLAEISSPDIGAAANVCATSTNYTVRMPGGGTNVVTLPRYRCGIVLSSAAAPRQSMDEILEAMAGRSGWAGGTWRVKAGHMPAPVFALDEGWLANPMQGPDPDPAPTLTFSNGVPREQKVNRVSGLCVDPDQRYQILPWPAVQDAALIAAEGSTYPLEVDYQGVNHIAHAQHLGTVAIRRAQAALQIQAQCNLHAYAVELFDVGTVSLARYGMNGKTVEALSWRWHPTQGVTLALQEITPEIFTPVAELTGRDPAPNSNFPQPWNVEQVTGVSITSGTVPLVDGSVLTRTRIAWNPVVSQSVRSGGKIQVQYIEATAGLPSGDWPIWDEAGDATAAVIPALRAGITYVFRVRAVSAPPLGVHGPWSLQTVHLVAPPPSVALKSLRVRASSLVFQVPVTGPTTPASITLTAEMTALAGTPVWDVIDGTATLGGAVNAPVRTLASADLTTDTASIRVTWDARIDIVTIVKVRDGARGTQTGTAYLYQWAASTPGNPSGASTYTWASGTNGTYTGGAGWATTIGANPGTPGIKHWVASKPVTANAGAASTGVDWTSGFTIVAATQNGSNGADGANGLQAAAPTVYAWAATIPSAPAGAPTYTWSTASFGAAPAGWALTPGASPSAGYTLWGASVAVVDSAAAASTAFNWSSSVITARGYAGTTGTAGASARYCYQRVPGNPAPASGFVTTAGTNSFPTSAQSNATWGINQAWAASDPNPSSTDTLYQSDGVYDPATGNTVWATPYISSLKVGSLSAITVNTGALTLTGDLTLSPTSALRAGNGNYGVAGGWFAGYDGGAYKFSLGDKLTFDGTTLTIGASSVSGLAAVATTGTLDYSAVGGTKPPASATPHQVFRAYTAPIGGTYFVGDVWYEQTGGGVGRVHNWNGSAWVAQMRGPIVAVVSGHAVWSDAAANAAIAAQGGGSGQPGDTVTLYNATFSSTKMLSNSSNGWVEVVAQINGSLLVTGSVSAAAIAAGSLFAGMTLNVGSAVRSGTTMTGSGADINANGTAAIGNVSSNMTFNGTQITMNGPVVLGGTITNPTIVNPDLGGFTASVPAGAISSPGNGNTGTNGVTMGSRAITATGGKTPYTYNFAVVSSYADRSGRVFIESVSGNTVWVGAVGNDEQVDGLIECTVVDANGRSAIASFVASGGYGTIP